MTHKFQMWKEDVNRHIGTVTTLELADLQSVNWYELYEEGRSPREAAFTGLILDGFFTEYDVDERWPGWDAEPVDDLPF